MDILLLPYLFNVKLYFYFWHLSTLPPLILLFFPISVTPIGEQLFVFLPPQLTSRGSYFSVSVNGDLSQCSYRSEWEQVWAVLLSKRPGAAEPQHVPEGSPLHRGQPGRPAGPWVAPPAHTYPASPACRGLAARWPACGPLPPARGWLPGLNTQTNIYMQYKKCKTLCSLTRKVKSVIPFGCININKLVY